MHLALETGRNTNHPAERQAVPPHVSPAKTVVHDFKIGIPSLPKQSHIF